MAEHAAVIAGGGPTGLMLAGELALAGVDVQRSDGPPLRANHLVGCDGGLSLIRKAAGIEFPGWAPATSSLIAEVEMAEEPGMGPAPRRARDPFLEEDGGWVR
jgi:2-polyprenyl-6-methoxyphenol hydroxylase-like FAD-dependent oxidoreductase